MLKNEFPKLNFKGFIIDNAQTNWNVVKIIYGSRDPFVMMVDKECAFFSIGLDHSVGTPNS
jgi:hypothetical protein